MKRISLLLIIFAMMGLSAEETVTLSDGRMVLLKDDNTYEFKQFEEHIVISLINIRDEISSWSDDEIVTLSFRVENHAFGSLYRLRLDVDAIDDRHKMFNEYGFSDLDTSENNLNVINLHDSGIFTVSFHGRKEFLRFVTLGEIDERLFSMRMLPEDVNVNSLLKVNSEVAGIELTF